jgi:hypothetical protein
MALSFDLHRSLEEKLARTEGQFSLLRGMVSERVRRKSREPASQAEYEPAEPPHRDPPEICGFEDDTNESHRRYGCW